MVITDETLLPRLGKFIKRKTVDRYFEKVISFDLSTTSLFSKTREEDRPNDPSHKDVEHVERGHRPKTQRQSYRGPVKGTVGGRTPKTSSQGDDFVKGYL